MSGDAKAAIAETRVKARELLFTPDGKMKGPDQLASLWTMQMLLPQVATVEELNAGSIVFDWRGSTHVYRKDIADVLMAGADGDAFIDRVFCGTAAIMLDALYSIPDPKLRSYVCGRLMGGLAPLTKRGRGQKKTSNDYRDVVIAGWLIPPLLDRFKATRNDATKQKGKTVSACWIVSQALAGLGHAGYDGINISEDRLEGIWGKVSHVLTK